MTDLSAVALRQVKAEALQELSGLNEAAALEAWRVKYLGRKGLVPQLLRGVKEAPEVARRQLGQAGNQVRLELERAYALQQKKITPKVAPTIEVKNGHRNFQGYFHPMTQTLRRIAAIMSELGYAMAEGPLVEEARYNFDLLNMPLEHPARAETDTFYINGGLVLRTSTSTMQLRAVLDNHLQPPFRIFSPGRTFRNERTDASHEATFHQFEGINVGTNISVANLRDTIEKIYSAFFGKAVTTRLRPSFFPFVEPGFEVDVNCLFCAGRGCRVCKRSGWIEIMGAGMVHPNVLRNMNIDPDKYQGFAFGGAVDRIAMLRYGINDIRLFWSGDLRFLTQF